MIGFSFFWGGGGVGYYFGGSARGDFPISHTPRTIHIRDCAIIIRRGIENPGGGGGII